MSDSTKNRQRRPYQSTSAPTMHPTQSGGAEKLVAAAHQIGFSAKELEQLCAVYAPAFALDKTNEPDKSTA